MYDFYSDCRTIPSRAMRETVLDAPVGDEQRLEDPTTLALCKRVAALLGKEDALFMPTGTMCNEVAAYILCSRGEVLICERGAHIINFEAGGPAALAGAQIQPINGDRGMFSCEDVDDALKVTSKTGHYHARPAMASFEQTTNLGGGAVWPADVLSLVASHCRSRGLKTYLDGARLFNAAVKSGHPVEVYARSFDAVSIDFTKGLGCPFGAVLAGTSEFIDRARTIRQMFGGGLRQSGIMAAMAHYALDHNVARLEQDHRVASYIGAELARMKSVERVLPVETNIVIFETSPQGPTAQEVVSFAAERGFRVGAFGKRVVRVVTHLDVDMDAGVALAAALGDAFAAHQHEVSAG